jgi:hypothetical protein
MSCMYCSSICIPTVSLLNYFKTEVSSRFQWGLARRKTDIICWFSCLNLRSLRLGPYFPLKRQAVPYKPKDRSFHSSYSRQYVNHESQHTSILPLPLQTVQPAKTLTTIHPLQSPPPQKSSHDNNYFLQSWSLALQRNLSQPVETFTIQLATFHPLLSKRQ